MELKVTEETEMWRPEPMNSGSVGVLSTDLTLRSSMMMISLEDAVTYKGAKARTWAETVEIKTLSSVRVCMDFGAEGAV